MPSMRSLSELSVIFVVVLAFTAVSVRSEYTWNGSEWVWSETPETKQQDIQNSNYGYEGSGGGGEDDDIEDNFDDEYNEFGSGVDQEPDPYPDPDPPVRNPNPWDYPTNNSPNPTKAPLWPVETKVDTNPVYVDPVYVDPPVVPEPPSTTPVVPSSGDHDPSKKTPSRTSFFAQPGTLAAVIGGAVVGLLCAILCVMFVVYRMRKKDEGSYALDEPKRSPTVNAYAKHPSREFYA